MKEGKNKPMKDESSLLYRYIMKEEVSDIP